MNGTAVDMAAEHDIVIFATDPSNAADLTAIEVMTDQRGTEDTVYLALTDADLPLSKARALTRAGVDDVLPYPSRPETRSSNRWAMWIARKRAAIEERYTSSWARAASWSAVQQARGGIGSTTIAVNLGRSCFWIGAARSSKEASNRVGHRRSGFAVWNRRRLPGCR